MKAIVLEKELPKFLKVNGVPESESYNKFLLKPWKRGELVKVDLAENQIPTKGVENITKVFFRERFVRVIRKDDEGKWTLNYTASWEIFNKLK